VEEVLRWLSTSASSSIIEHHRALVWASLVGGLVAFPCQGLQAHYSGCVRVLLGLGRIAGTHRRQVPQATSVAEPARRHAPPLKIRTFNSHLSLPFSLTAILHINLAGSPVLQLALGCAPACSPLGPGAKGDRTTFCPPRPAYHSLLLPTLSPPHTLSSQRSLRLKVRSALDLHPVVVPSGCVTSLEQSRCVSCPSAERNCMRRGSSD
jgi:hypothetical protein